MSDTAAITAPTDENGVEIICPTLHHTGNQTGRQQEMIRWYENVLGQQVMHAAQPPATPVPITWTSNDSAHHRMGFVAVANLEDTVFRDDSPGVQHTAWEFESIDDLLNSWERIKNLGIEPQFCVDHGISFAFYYRDPDGNMVELLTDAYGDWETSRRTFLESQRVHDNPPGTPVDPAKLLEARRAGMSLEDLHEKAWSGEFPPENAHNHELTDEQLGN